MSVFLGWFLKPQPRVVIDCPGLESHNISIVNHFLNQGSVLMLFERPEFDTRVIPRDHIDKDLQQNILIWNDTKNLLEGLKHSTIYVYSDEDTNGLGVARTDIKVSNIHDVLNINVRELLNGYSTNSQRPKWYGCI